MISKKDIYSLRYFLVFALILISFYVYSGATGWKWVGGVKTEKEKSTGGTGTHRPGSYYRYYHK